MTPEHPLRIEAEKQFNNLMVDNDERGFYMQPCFSPIWDTAIAAFALAETENPPAAALRRCRRLDALERNSAQGRLVRQASECGALRLGL